MKLPSVPLPDPGAELEARRRLDQLTKPPGSLGRLEELAVRLSGITGMCPPPLRDPVIFTLAGDHGVVAQGVSAYPQIVTAQMVENFLRGGAAVNVLARHAGARVVVADLGVAVPLPRHPDLRDCKVALGTADMTRGPAMTPEQCARAIEAGIGLVEAERARGADLIGTGEMGIGNTTAASAIVAALTGASPESVTGPGTGVDAAGRRRKVEAIRRALAVNQPDPACPSCSAASSPAPRRSRRSGSGRKRAGPCSPRTARPSRGTPAFSKPWVSSPTWISACAWARGRARRCASAWRARR